MSKLDIISRSSGDGQKHLSQIGDPELRDKVANSLDSYIDVKLTAAQLDALNATPVTLIAAPGSGKFIHVSKVVGFLDYNSAAYAGSSETLAIRYTDGSGDIICQFTEATFIEATADAYEAPDMIQVFPVVNSPVVAHATADFTSGNSPIYLRIWYNVVDLADLGSAS